MSEREVISVVRGRLESLPDDDEDEDSTPYHRDGDMSGPMTRSGGGVSPWARMEGSRAALGRFKAKFFETRLASHVRRAQLALSDSLKHASWAVEHKVGQSGVRRGL